jgi:hypothetical protein
MWPALVAVNSYSASISEHFYHSMVTSKNGMLSPRLPAGKPLNPGTGLSTKGLLPMDFKNALWELILGSSGRIQESYKGSALLVFAAGSAIMGFIAVLLDRTVYSVRGRSFFHLGYGGGIIKTGWLIFLWGFGAGVGGFLGSAASIVQFTRSACIGVGVGWPLILPRLIDSFTRDQDQQKPEDKQNGDK